MTNFKKRKLIEIYERLYSFYGPQHWWPGESPFEVAVGAVLTQNTNWANVEKAMANLKREGVLNPEALHRMSSDTLSRLIRPSGYFVVKTGRLKAFVRFLIDDYKGTLRRMRREDTAVLRKKLLDVHGIGEETADSIILYALEKPIFVIDTYTRRVLFRHGLAEAGLKYVEYQRLFHEALPQDARLFNEYHALLVRVGKEYCKPRPLCEGCPLGLLDVDPVTHDLVSTEILIKK